MAGLRFHYTIEPTDIPGMAGGWFDAPAPIPVTHCTEEAFTALEAHLSQLLDGARVVIQRVEIRQDIERVNYQFISPLTLRTNP